MSDLNKLPARQRMAYETMATMENRIYQLKNDLENAVRRGDELFDQLERMKVETRKTNSSFYEYRGKYEELRDLHNSKISMLSDLIYSLEKQIAKKDEIIKELEGSNEFYAKESNWQNVTAKVRKTGGRLAREKKKKVESIRNDNDI